VNLDYPFSLYPNLIFDVIAQDHSNARAFAHSLVVVNFC